MDSTTVPPTDPPTAAPTDAPTAGTDPTNPTATTRDPNNNCPGGNLEACISLCPEEDADIYQACVHDSLPSELLHQVAFFQVTATSKAFTWKEFFRRRGG